MHSHTHTHRKQKEKPNQKKPLSPHYLKTHRCIKITSSFSSSVAIHLLIVHKGHTLNNMMKDELSCTKFCTTNGGHKAKDFKASFTLQI